MKSLLTALAAIWFLLPQLAAQNLTSSARRAWASHIVVPQTRSFSVRPQPARVLITGVNVGVVIVEQAATTTMEIALSNPTNQRLEAEMVVPVPDGAVIKGLDFQGNAKAPTAQLLRKEEARRIYNSIVAQVKDPALLEFIGFNLIRSSVFPVEPRGTQKIRLTYENLLPADANRIDYYLPRSESLAYRVPWNVSVSIKSKKPISTVYSPSHEIDFVRKGPNLMAAKVVQTATTEPGPFRLSYLLDKAGVTASLMAYPDPKIGGGYFLLLAGLPASPKVVQNRIRREVTLVIDRSGSMNGEKIKQVREAAMQVLGGLEDGEAFNIIVYNQAVESFSAQPVIKSDATITAARRYLKSVYPRGGTNIHDALVESLKQKPIEDTLPIVLFLTDGLPTIGETAEKVIRETAVKSNPFNRRVFTFGVGVDVNTPLLENIASQTRATTTVVLPKEDVEVKVGQVFKRLSGPVLASPTLSLTKSGKPDLGRIRDLIPNKLPDLFEDDQLILLGQYIGNEPLKFKLEGNYFGKRRTFEFDFGLERATTKNGFVPRLWASRQIGILLDAIRMAGANGGPLPIHQASRLDPKIKELVDEVVRLSTEFGILTEYTAFLAREGTDLKNKERILKQAEGNFVRRSHGNRSGIGSWNQDYNRQLQKGQKSLNISNGYLDQNLKRVEITSVQQVNDLCFYRKNGRWVDSRVVDKDEKAKPEKVIEFGSKEFNDLTATLAQQGRQGSVSLRGDILLSIDGKSVLVRNAPFANLKKAKVAK
ncbi:MAG: VIT domain-containing protein [Planctomycetota bacterium]|nr:VIT domain-containing protein [Planctomycetota bacterium]